MVLVAAVPAYARDASSGDNEENNESIVFVGDGSQLGFNGLEQELDQTAYRYNDPVANTNGDGNEVAQDGNSVEADQEQYSFDLLYGFNDAGIDDSFDYFILFGDFDGVDDEFEDDEDEANPATSRARAPSS